MGRIVKTNLQCPVCGSSDGGAIYKNKDKQSGDDLYIFKCFSGHHPSNPKAYKLPQEFLESYEDEVMRRHNKALGKDYDKTIDKELEDMTTDTTKDKIPMGLIDTGSFEDLDNKEHPWNVRGISENTCRFYGVKVAKNVRVSRNQKTLDTLAAQGESPFGEGLIFPYFSSVKNELIAQKVRTKVDKKGSWYKANENAVTLSGFFGQQLFQSTSHDDIAITFGELDAMSVYQMIGIPTVSVKDGDTSAPKLFRQEYGWLSRFRTIYVIPDNDDSCRAVLPAIGAIFPKKIKIVHLSKHKDPNDYLVNGDAQLFRREFNTAAPFSPEQIISLKELSHLLYEDPPKPVADYPWEGLNKMTGGIWAGELITVKAPPKIGKCFGRGTPIRMFDGSVKEVQDIREGELVMGEDSLPRRVVGVTKGVDKLFKVKQSRGMDYVVNSAHILSVKNKKGDVEDINVRDFMSLNPWQVKVRGLRGFKNPIHYTPKDIPLEPYMLGLWLGDGHADSASITNVDSEIEEYMKVFAAENALRITKNEISHYFVKSSGNTKDPSSFMKALRELNLIKNKHIPDVYKYNTREVRLAVLAGLIDSDGTLCAKGLSYDIILKNKKLTEDLIELANSLGFTTSMSPCLKSCVYKGEKREGVYYRTFISGDMRDLPLKVSHKKPLKFFSRFNPTHSKLDIEYIGTGEYFGFELEGLSKRFLLADGTVVHNTSILSAIAYHLKETTNKPIGLIYLEETQRDLIFRFVSMKLRKNLQRQEVLASTTREEIEEAQRELFETDNVFVVDKSGSCPSDFIEEKITELVRAKGCEFIFFDHISMAITDESNKDERIALDRLVSAIKALTVGIPDIETVESIENGERTYKTVQVIRQPTIFMVTHVNDAGQTRGSRAAVQLSNLVIALKRDKLAKDRAAKNTTEIVIEESRRYGESGLACKLYYDALTSSFVEVPIVEEGEEENDTPVFDNTKQGQSFVYQAVSNFK